MENFFSKSVIVSALSWGEYTDALIICIDEMDVIELKVNISTKVAPVIYPTSFVRFGGVPAAESAVKKIPITNLAPHPITINFFLLDNVSENDINKELLLIAYYSLA